MLRARHESSYLNHNWTFCCWDILPMMRRLVSIRPSHESLTVLAFANIAAPSQPVHPCWQEELPRIAIEQ